MDNGVEPTPWTRLLNIPQTLDHNLLERKTVLSGVHVAKCVCDVYKEAQY